MAAEITISSLPQVPKRRMQWGRAFRALRRLSRGEYDGDAIEEYALALDGGDSERDIRRFLAEPDAARLVAEGSDLAALLDDAERLRSMPMGSFGRTYLELAERDGIRVADLVEKFRRAPEYAEMFPDPVRAWIGSRGIGGHDLDHVITGYDRSEPGEALLIAFSLAYRPRRVFAVSMVMTLLMVPKRVWIPYVADLFRAWKRGRAARIGRAVEWEKLLPLPIEEVRRRLHLTSLEEAHPQGRWRILPESGAWERTPHPASPPLGIFAAAARAQLRHPAGGSSGVARLPGV